MKVLVPVSHYRPEGSTCTGSPIFAVDGPMAELAMYCIRSQDRKRSLILRVESCYRFERRFEEKHLLLLSGRLPANEGGNLPIQDHW